METYFFRPELYARMYNCSRFDYEGWRRFGTPNLPMGILCILSGIVLQLVYFPFLVTMSREKFIRNSCYKLMFYLGIMDFATLYSSSFISGYLTIRGVVFCMNPPLVYFTGLQGFASWASSCMTCMLLTINRCIDIYFPHLGRRLFHGRRTWLWLMLPVGIYFWVLFFETTVTYNSSYLSWFFNPYYGMNLPESSDPIYHSYLHTTINMLTVIVLFIGNSILCHYVIRRSKSMSQEGSFRFQRQFLIQVFVISVPFFMCALLYVYMQFFYSPFWLTFMASLTFIANSGVAALTYIFLNPTLKRATFELCLRRKSMTKISFLSHIGGSSSTDDPAKAGHRYIEHTTIIPSSRSTRRC